MSEETENEVKTEAQKLFEEMLEEEQKKFDNADGAVFTDEEVPHHVVRRLYHRTHEHKILSRSLLHWKKWNFCGRR